jgi:hypothetical protein
LETRRRHISPIAVCRTPVFWLADRMIVTFSGAIV